MQGSSPVYSECGNCTMLRKLNDRIQRTMVPMPAYLIFTFLLLLGYFYLVSFVFADPF
jgi:hypothetical protein